VGHVLPMGETSSAFGILVRSEGTTQKIYA
jgi:hypothetical protein